MSGFETRTFHLAVGNTKNWKNGFLLFKIKKKIKAQTTYKKLITNRPLNKIILLLLIEVYRNS